MNYSKINNLIILDTNVIISAQLSKHPDSATKQVYGYATNGIKITPTPSQTKLSDQKDQPFYDLVTTKA